MLVYVKRARSSICILTEILFSLKQNTFNSKISILSLYNSTVYDGDKGSVILTLVFCIQPLILKFHDCTKSARSCSALRNWRLMTKSFHIFLRKYKQNSIRQ